MAEQKYKLICVIFLYEVLLIGCVTDNTLIRHFTALVKSRETIFFSCSEEGLKYAPFSLVEENQFVSTVHLDSNYTLKSILDRRHVARTSVIVNMNCKNSFKLLDLASSDRYFNKTYQWLWLNFSKRHLDMLYASDINCIGPNSQIAFVNSSQGVYQMWDIHSKGLLLIREFEVNLIGEFYTTTNGTYKWQEKNNIFQLQGIKFRDKFKGLTLRGASVIDQDSIETNKQIEEILSRPTKDPGVAAFSKYHYELLRILQERFNFTVNFRNARGWAGRLGNSLYRLGFLGIVMRNEADIGASAAFNRINRFAEFDIIHQSWKFETAFLYRFTPELDTHDKNGNFLTPFDWKVWCLAVTSMIVINFIWYMVEYLNDYVNKETKDDTGNCRQLLKQFRNSTSFSEVSLKTFGAICQQGMDPIPKGLPSRTIVMTMFVFSLVIYNYYTSAVVGGLLSSAGNGPDSVKEIVDSPLKISFEDIGYYKVLFRENKSPLVTHLITSKLSTPRSSFEVPVYTHIEEAVPHLKTGGFAFHCEVVDAYPVISKYFDANEICDLRVVSGLMDVEIMNWVVHKNSQYTEIFKIAMCRAREIGLINRLLQERQPKKPTCESRYNVYPVSLSGVLSAFFILFGGFLVSIVVFGIEVTIYKHHLY